MSSHVKHVIDVSSVAVNDLSVSLEPFGHVHVEVAASNTAGSSQGKHLVCALFGA